MGLCKAQDQSTALHPVFDQPPKGDCCWTAHVFPPSPQGSEKHNKNANTILQMHGVSFPCQRCQHSVTHADVSHKQVVSAVQTAQLSWHPLEALVHADYGLLQQSRLNMMNEGWALHMGWAVTWAGPTHRLGHHMG